MKTIYKLEELSGKAYDTAVEKARKELHEAFHWNTEKASAPLLEELANDCGLRFNADGDFI